VDGQRKALIVANDEYDHPGLQRLWSAAADAEALAGVLGDPQVGGFAVEVARNRPAHDVGVQIEDLFSESTVADVLLLHFSCHGLKDESGELYFATRNTRPNRLGSTAISAAFVQRCMRASRSHSIVLLLDCCYGGAFSQGVSVRAAGDVNVLDSFPVGRLGGGRGRAVITASSSMEYAFEGDQLAEAQGPSPSVFTAALVEGLATGNADRDEDGWVSLNELYDYVFDKVRERNPHQTPSRDVEMQGELYLARSRRRRIHPAAVPADLRAAMTDPNMFSRLGAAGELRSRLLGDNLAVAAGAHDALTEMAATDIRYVADAARAALREAAARPDPAMLHFGPVPQDEDPPRRTVRLQGPAIVRAGTLETSDPWIRTEEAEVGFDVTVTTARAGSFHGHVTVRGPTGEVTVPVDLEVLPKPTPLSAPARPPAAPVAAALAPSGPTQPSPSEAPPPPAAETPPISAVPREPLRYQARQHRFQEHEGDSRPWSMAPGSPPTSAEPLAAVPDRIRAAPADGHSLRPMRCLWTIRAETSRVDSWLGSRQAVRSVAFSPDGRLVASGGDKGAWLWFLDTGTLRHPPIRRHASEVHAVAFSPDGRLLATCGRDRKVGLWNALPGERGGQLHKGHAGPVYAVAFSPDGRLLASASGDHTVRLWNPTTGAPGYQLIGHAGPVYAVAFSPDGRLVASASGDHTVRLWNPLTGQPLAQPVTHHAGPVYAVAFSPDGRLVASASDDHTVRLSNPTTGRVGQPLHSWARAVAFKPDGSLILTANYEEAVLWNATTGDVVDRLICRDGWTLAVAFSRDGNLVATAGEKGTVRLWGR
jgi:roadblock/LC7 domain-containing protein